MKIRKVKLGNLISVLTDYHANGSYKLLKKNVKLLDEPSFAIMIRTTNFEQNNFQNNKYINEYAYNFLRKSKVYPNDILMNKIANAGSVYLMPDLKKPVSLGMNLFLIRIKPELADPEYVYYYLKTNEKYIKLFATGAATSTITKEMVRRLEIILPKNTIQKKIATVIFFYNNLIDINYRTMKLLEEAARLLYREWFVYFRFPGHENVKIVDGIPEGWKKDKLNKFVEFKKGVEPGSKNYMENNEMFSYPFFRVSDLVSRDPEIYVDELCIKGALLEKKDIVVSLDGSVGIVSMGLKGSYSTGIRKLIIKNDHINRGFLYCLMKSKYIQGIIKAYSKGTTIQHAGESVKHIKYLMPTKGLMDKFGEISEPMIDEILILLDQNQKLAQARDLLLPRLMSGEIDVSEFDKDSIHMESEVEKIVN